MFAHFGYFISFVFMCPVSPNHNSSFFGIYQKKPYKLIYYLSLSGTICHYL